MVEHGIWEWAILRPRGQGKKGQLIWMQMLSKGKIQSADDLETGQHSYCARNHVGPCM